MSDLVLYDLRPPAAVLTINRAEKRNALNRELVAALAAAFTRADADVAARCVILTNAGPTFCSGMDLAELQDAINHMSGPDQTWDDAVTLARLYDQIYTMPKPTIAVVNGAAVAGGAGLVSVCDLAISTPDARFGYPEVRRGLVAAIVMPHLLRHVGERAARYLLLTGDVIDGVEALRCGLVNEVVPTARLLGRAMEIAHAIAEGGPQALATTKSLLRQYSTQRGSVEDAARASAAPRLGAECRAGLAAFFDKKPAPWMK